MKTEFPLSFYLNTGLLFVAVCAVVAGGALGVVSIRVQTEKLGREVREHERNLAFYEQQMRSLEGRISQERQPENLLALAQAQQLGLKEPRQGSVHRMHPYPGELELERGLAQVAETTPETGYQAYSAALQGYRSGTGR